MASLIEAVITLLSRFVINTISTLGYTGILVTMAIESACIPLPSEIIMIGSLAGSVIGVSLIAFGVMKRDEYIPFGPFLVLGALVSLFYAQPLLDWYQNLLSPSF